ncbi:ribose-5-phosphate isomerase RpiA [Polynucleobacter sp. MWH-Spelu-300-X4]|jgi:ribose 5-phosphate isomerase A|uniref:ribose-5-phosphate isomerase RpiA n=1 Tax=Polynucleobacter sp. MWH-Spelu-300-X4 TaxID=2689109 RepID=UPI001BFE4B59|nr:ribose-5-phosphate isomerase RpiA [Polynucleobacter sp. MWH-Spelu-300-X4]QWD80513.1 ribose-5-phosphate isomerase RpiA [Polynucleobacter sp. MWH-Spelu-300-X4]
MYTQDQLKAMVAEAAKDEVLKAMAPGGILGVGTGSTANLFIDALAPHKDYFSGVISSSQASTERLRKHGFNVLDSNAVNAVPMYVDGADEIDPQGHMLKGGGGALTREKIVAQLAQSFICICDASKQVDVMGKFPLPVEVIPMAQAQVTRELEKLGGRVTLRQVKDTNQTFVTDNQAWILDVAGLSITDPVQLESDLNQIPGVICNGLFARRKANILLIGEAQGVRRQIFN